MGDSGDTPPCPRSDVQEMKLLFCVFVAGLFLARSAYCVSVLPAKGLHVATDSTATLSCLADPGRERESVIWLKGDTRSPVAVAGLNDSRISTTQNNLTISNFHYSTHGGLYSCSVEGPSGHTQLSCPVHLQHARILANITSSVVTKVKHVGENSTVALVCEAPLSWPPAEFYWEKDGERVDHEADNRFWLLPSGNLYIVGVTVQDEGLYTCTAVNPVTQALRHSRVQYQFTVNIVPPMNETLPTFTVRPTDAVAVVGGETLIECSGHAHPKPRLEWVPIHDIHFPREGRVLPTGALHFDPVTTDDAGVYRCLLSNSAGRVHVDIKVEVKEPPSLINTPESLMELPLTLGHVGSSNATSTNTLTCAANGSPPLDLLLMHDGNVLSTETVTNSSEQVSLTHTITDNGFYQCFATNEFGCEQWTTFVTLDAHISTEAVTEILTSTGERSLTMAESSTSPLSGHTERPLDESTPETPTITGEVIPTTQTSTNAEPSTLATTDPFTGSAEMPITERAGDSTTPRQLSTSQDTTNPPTPPPLTTPPELDILTNGDLLKAEPGSKLTFECEVRGGGDGTQLTWYFNGQPLLDIDIEEKQGSNRERVLVSQLKFDEVMLSHAGEYMCRAHSLLRNETLSAPIKLTVFRLLPPPIGLTVSAGERGGLLVSWQPNSHSDDLLVGYKLAWDIPTHVTQTAVTSTPRDVTHYLIVGLDLSLEYMVLVWPYNIEGDGMPANATWNPRVSMTTTTAGEMSTSTTNNQPAAACVATEMGPTQVLLKWPVEVGGVNITASCLNSHTSSVIPVAMTTQSYMLDQLLPNCHYNIRVGGFNCSVTTPPGDVDLSATVHRLDNGSIQLDWNLPRELRGGSDLVVEVNANGDWLPIHRHGNTPHIPMHFEKDMEHRVQFRFQSGEWVGFAVIIIPSLSQTTSPSTVSMVTPKGEEFYLTEYGLIYGVIFGSLVVACASVLVIILVLKYIQMSRRENDKVTDDREKHREEFRRMSLERSSVKSLKKGPVRNMYPPKQTDV